MSNREFATKLYEFLKENEPSGNFIKTPKEACIAELENYLSDLHMVKETIKDIEEVSDMLDDHEFYVAEVKPLLYGLRELQGELETEQSRRMVGDTNYEVIHAIHVGDKEIVFAEDKNADNGMNWFVGNYTSNDIIGEYADCQINSDYIDSMSEFSKRVSKQVEMIKTESDRSEPPHSVFTAEHCYRNDYSQSIDGKIVAIKAEILRPEYRRGNVQIVLVDGGNGARANPNGRAVYCYHLNDGTRTRFERHDIQGEVMREFLPMWAAEKAAEILADKSAPPKEKHKNRDDR
jgi:hypothetical protein